MEADPTATLAKLNSSLDKLETALEPLLARPLAETRDALPPLDRAKLDVLLAFAANNLVWVYLQTRGIDPDKHGVATELERVRQYYTKVQDAEGGKPKTRNRLDKAAARRFITHSLAANEVGGDAGPANANAALARRQAEVATRARETDEASQARRANRFRFVAETAERMPPADGEADEQGGEEDEDEDEDEDEADALLAEAYEAANAVGDDDDDEDDEDYEMDEEMDDDGPDTHGLADIPVPEPAGARVDPPATRASRSKRKRAEDMG